MPIKKYYQLTKPGIIYGNVMTAAAGFLLASKWHVDVRLFLATIVGTSLVIAAACVTNNYIDRGIDIKMARTKKRALVSGSIAPKNAIAFAVILGLLGFLVLIAYSTLQVAAIGAAALVDYVLLYGVAKRRSVHGTLVGSFAGAAPILAGYVAARGHFDSGALVVFLILLLWQMPHFYAIASYRFNDYKAAGLPVLPVKSGVRAAKRQILAYIAAFIIATTLLTVLGYTGYIYLFVMTAIGLLWFRYGLRGFKTADDKLWSRKMFLISLVVILVVSIMMPLGAILP